MPTKSCFWPMIAFLALALVAKTGQASPREKVSLDGTWQFATDPENVGDAQQWFMPDASMLKMPLEGYDPGADGTIQVPGIWDNQGYGTETDKVHHNFVGKGWYKRTVTIPETWQGEQVFFCLNSISRAARVWVNGHSAGPEAIGFVGPHEWEISDLLVPGKEADITVCVDSHQRWDVDPLLGATSLNDYMEIEWGGIWGHAWLEARPTTRLESVYLRSDIHASTCTAEVSLSDQSGIQNAALKMEVRGSDGNVVAQTTSPVHDFNALQKITVTIPDVKLWTPDTPALYDVQVSLLQDNQLLDSLNQRTGIREIRIEGRNILLNGKRFFFRGYGDDHIYPYEFSMPTDKEMLKKRLEIIKSYGFNFVRNHSAIHPHEYFEACDELGMLTTGEFPIGYPQQLPGEGNLWKARAGEKTDPQPALQTILDRWAAVVRDYRHHPSVLGWVGGNELNMLDLTRWEKMPLRYDMKKIANDLDPDRFFCDDDGDWKSNLITRGRDTLDVWFMLFPEWDNPISSQIEKFQTGPLAKPTISHESGNYVMFSRPSQIEDFHCNYKPFWMTPGKEKLTQLGLLNEADDWADATEQLYVLSHKYNVEGMRLNPEISGYQWWLFQDYWTTANGIFDLFFKPKSIRPEEILPFNNDTVLLQKGLPRTCRTGETFDLETLISNFSGIDLTGQGTITLTAGGKQHLEETFQAQKLPNGDLSSLKKLEVSVPNVTEPTEVILSLEFHTEGRSFANHWTTWFFPKATKAETKDVPVYISSDAAGLPDSWTRNDLPDSPDLPAQAVYVTSWLDSRLLKALNEGAGVVLINNSQLLPALATQYQSTWWKPGENSQNNHTGTFFYPNSVTARMTSGNWGDLQWLDLLQGAVKYNLESAACRPHVLIRAVTSLVRVEDMAFLYEVAVGKGTLVVSGLNHQAVANSPANETILAAMIERAAEQNPPSESWDPDQILPPTRIPEGTVLGYTRCLDLQNAEQSFWKSFKTNASPVFVCRQDKKSNRILWQTDLVDARLLTGKTVTFVFAGTLGFLQEKPADGFLLVMNDKVQIPFNHPEKEETTTWKSSDGTASLTFDLRKKEGGDLFGVFSLTVPNSVLIPDKGQELEVRSLGEGSRRWFGLYPLNDLL